MSITAILALPCYSCICPCQHVDKQRDMLHSCAGLIPADGDVWKTRRRVVVPSLHRRYIANMIGMFGDCAMHGVASLQQAQQVLIGLCSAVLNLAGSCGDAHAAGMGHRESHSPPVHEGT